MFNFSRRCRIARVTGLVYMQLRAQLWQPRSDLRKSSATLTCGSPGWPWRSVARRFRATTRSGTASPYASRSSSGSSGRTIAPGSRRTRYAPKPGVLRSCDTLRSLLLASSACTSTCRSPSVWSALRSSPLLAPKSSACVKDGRRQLLPRCFDIATFFLPARSQRPCVEVGPAWQCTPGCEGRGPSVYRKDRVSEKCASI